MFPHPSYPNDHRVVELVGTTQTSSQSSRFDIGGPGPWDSSVPKAKTPWWRDAVCYEIYIRSFADADGDGVGDMAGIERRLPYLADLGVDAIWITPFYPSPQKDHGYDVADYCDVETRFGTLADFDAMLARAHDLGIRVIIDVVPNHTSSEHPWFADALAAGPDSPERERFVFRDGKGVEGNEPPNNWLSIFGGAAWTREYDADARPAQWYLHMFDSTQPDLNWHNPAVGDDFEAILRFWLDRGVDGFRIDVAHGLFVPDDLADTLTGDETTIFHQPEVHEVYRRWRRVLEEYDGDRMAVAEAWTDSPETTSSYIRPDELHQAFNFHWLLAEWSAEAFRGVVTRTLEAVGLVGGSATWVLSNHDVVRHVTRYGGGDLGRARGRAALLTMLALPGSSYLFQGEELGLEQVDVAPEHRQDPAYFRGGAVGRDGCRVPLPWGGSRPPYDFGPGAGQPWLPQPSDWTAQSVSAQSADPDSMLSFYQRALAARGEVAHGLDDSVHLLDSAPGTFAFRRGDHLVCVVNCGPEPAALPDEAGDVILASSPLVEPRALPPDTAAWFRARTPR